MARFYEFHWKDGKTEYIEGKSEVDAAHNAGIGNGALAALDYVTDAKFVPFEHKKFVLVDIDGKQTVLGRETMFVNQAIHQLREGKHDLFINVCRSEWKVTATIKPFKVILKECL